VRYQFIKQHAGEFSVVRMCAVLRVSPSGYYAWARRSQSARARENEVLLSKIHEVHRTSRGAYGAHKTWRALRDRGIRCGRHRVARLRRAHGIEAKRRRRFRLTKRNYRHWPVAPNLVNQHFVTDRPDRVWMGDTTFIHTQAGTLYLAVLLDLYSRKVIGWAMAARHDETLAISAWTMALANRRPEVGLIHHTDQGGLYRSALYRGNILAQGARLSMSGKGNAYDNAVVESFFSSLKNELIHHQVFKTRDHARAAIFDYIEIFYNRQRLHASLNYTTPVAYESANLTPTHPVR
jgi:transposase InsO family protein